jgi:CRP/FNR family transcriptional regulator
MKDLKAGCDLKSCSFCRNCLKDWLPAIESNRKTLQLNKAERFIIEGDLVKGIFFIVEGAVKVHKRWGEKELIVRIAGKGDIIGHRGLGNDSFYPISATALTTARVCFVSLSFFLSSLKVNQEYLFKLMMFFAEELKISERKMRDLAHMPVKDRIAQALINLQTKFGVNQDGYINLEISKQDLASYTGATYETVFRALNELIRDNLIEIKGKTYSVPDLNRLSLAINRPG